VSSWIVIESPAFACVSAHVAVKVLPFPSVMGADRLGHDERMLDIGRLKGNVRLGERKADR
jgi:hypothetical protein